MANEAYHILFISSTLKGEVMVREMKAAGCTISLMTEESLRHEPWPYDAIDYIYFTPDLRRYQDVINTITWLARGTRYDLIVPLDEFEVELVSILREHMQLMGMNISHTRRFRDKLAMRRIAAENGIPVPDFIQILNYDALRDYMARVPAPWMLKPRMEAGAMGIRKIHDSEQLWRALDTLGDRQSYYLLERYLPGDVYHVDSIVVGGKIAFVSPQKYAAPPIDIYQGGGVFATQTLPSDSEEAQALKAINERVIKALGMVNGVTHAEYIRARADGSYYFLEIAARVGGAFISDMIEAATGVNLWREWGRLELALLMDKPYKLPKVKKQHAALVLTLARQEQPDTSAYNDPEIVWRADKPRHAGLIVASKSAERVSELLAQYRDRFIRDFTATAEPMDATRTGYSG